MDLTECKAVYADGGVIGPNPSLLGGTWACIFTDGFDCQIGSASGVVTPAEAGLPAVANNLTEFLACLEAMERLPDGWGGRFYTNSQVTLFRIRNERPKFRGIPYAWQDRLMAVRARLGKYECFLLDGDPTRKQLLAGLGKRGKPVSKWNVACVKECNRLAGVFRKQLAEKEA